MCVCFDFHQWKIGGEGERMREQC
ncbi:unnamed protein product [Spirodela intermedia]|uniref:Uncharacterized protein n=1 Tax=Spirodela intermedia TaxID=51605 RepID=A0ABN7E9H5_SPIIN|nr:unnamed protein product [Spirodela intermedia]